MTPFEYFGNVRVITVEPIYRWPFNENPHYYAQHPMPRFHRSMSMLTCQQFNPMLWEGTRTKEKDKGNFRTRGMRGCTESHLRLVKFARAKNWPCVAIAEDDVYLWADFQAKWACAYSALNGKANDWDLFYFYAKESADLNDERIRLLQVSGECHGHLYAVHSRFYDRYIEAVEAGMTEGKMQDETLYALPNKNVYAIHPPMAGQFPGYSRVSECDRPARYFPVEK